MKNGKIEDDIPTEHRAKLVMRVLAGPNMGAEASLGEGIWLIGSQEADDLTFADSELVGSHIRMVIQAGTLQITALADGVFIGKNRVATNSPTIVAPFAPIRVGRTIFNVGPLGDKASGVDALSKQGVLDVDSALAELGSLDHQRRRLPMGWIWPRLRPGAIVCCFLVGAYGYWAGTARLGSSTSVGLTSQPVKRMTDILPVSEASGVNIDENLADHSRALEDTEQQPKSPGFASDMAPKGATVAALSRKALIELGATVLNAFAIEGTIRVEGVGEITVIGYGQSDASVEAALRRLQQDIPGLHKVNDEVTTPDRARAFLEAAASVELRSSIRIGTKPNVVWVSGALTPTIYREWQTLASRFKDRFMPHVRLEARCELVELPVARGIHLGRTPSLVLRNGMRLKPGDNIGRLGKITSIDRDGVVVHLGDTNVRIPYASEPEWVAEEGR